MRLYYFLLGYIKIFIPEWARADAATALLRRGLSARFEADGSLRVPFFKRKRYLSALKKIECDTVAAGGLPVMLMSLSRRAGILSALGLLAALYIFSSFFVWDIRIEGNERVSDSVILKELSDVGFEVGSFWGASTRSDAEGALLAASDNVGWVNINRVGTVAYVTVKEKTAYQTEEGERAFSNVVATHDCVIEEITVESGVAAVKSGDTVRAGELLISGVIPSELGGGFTSAAGDVLGRISTEITVEVPRKETVTVLGAEKLYLAKIKIFKFDINIFKRYRKTDNTCAIIEDVKEYTLFGKYRIPISLERIYLAERINIERNYTDAELVQVAAARLSAIRSSSLGSAETVKIRTFGEYTDTGYKMNSQITVLANIGETRRIVGLTSLGIPGSTSSSGAHKASR